MRTMSRAAAVTLAVLATLALAGCGEDAECNIDWYDWDSSPGGVRGLFHGLELTELETVDLQSNSAGDTGTVVITGTGEAAGDDDDSSAGDDDDSARDEARDYDDLASIDTWQIDIQWEDTFDAGASTDGKYALKPRGSDCTTHSDKCFEAQIGFNSDTDREFFSLGRLEIFDPAGGLRGCLYVADGESDHEAEIDLYFTE
jgi:hypothetical protein